MQDSFSSARAYCSKHDDECPSQIVFDQLVVGVVGKEEIEVTVRQATLPLHYSSHASALILLEGSPCNHPTRGRQS